ncbi:unnamed protein product [Symbiodinium microadriaticum]|nr:unnamed protein product [Symbiodinium sp. KB8]CAE7223558.1 unnamed protein product [Symbiodinium microadriaticum]
MIDAGTYHKDGYSSSFWHTRADVSVIEGLFKNEQIDVPHMYLGTGISCDLLISPRKCLFEETSQKISPMNMPGHVVFLGLELKACSVALPSIHFQTHGYQAVRSASNLVLATFFYTDKKVKGCNTFLSGPLGSWEKAPQMLIPLPWDESQLQGLLSPAPSVGAISWGQPGAGCRLRLYG